MRTVDNECVFLPDKNPVFVVAMAFVGHHVPATIIVTSRTGHHHSGLLRRRLLWDTSYRQDSASTSWPHALYILASRLCLKNRPQNLGLILCTSWPQIGLNTWSHSLLFLASRLGLKTLVSCSVHIGLNTLASFTGTDLPEDWRLNLNILIYHYHLVFNTQRAYFGLKTDLLYHLHHSEKLCLKTRPQTLNPTTIIFWPCNTPLSPLRFSLRPYHCKVLHSRLSLNIPWPQDSASRQACTTKHYFNSNSQHY